MSVLIHLVGYLSNGSCLLIGLKSQSFIDDGAKGFLYLNLEKIEKVLEVKCLKDLASMLIESWIMFLLLNLGLNTRGV